MKLTEHDIQNTIIEYLQRKGYFVLRLNAGIIKSQANSFIRLAKAGTPDLLAYKKTAYNHQCRGYMGNSVDLYFIEVKRPDKKPTPKQQAMMNELTQYGAVCFVASSIEDVQKYII